jgi:uncharacterized membrane protein YdjX (TVP38/TMEM64 family)
MGLPLREILRRRSGVLKIVSLLPLVGAAILLARLLPGDWLRPWITARVAALGAAGPLLLTAAYVVLTLLLMPATPLALAAGAAYGVLGGGAINVAGSTLSAVLAFALARRFGRPAAVRRVARSPRLRALYEALGAPGSWKLVFAVRVGHLAPFGAQNYFFGVSRIPFRTFLLATWAMTAPASFFYAYVGAVGADALTDLVGGGSGHTLATWLLEGLGAAIAAAALLYIGVVARRAIAQATGLSAEELKELAAPAPQPADWPWATLAFFGLSLAALAAAVWAFLNQASIRQWLEQ